MNYKIHEPNDVTLTYEGFQTLKNVKEAKTVAIVMSEGEPELYEVGINHTLAENEIRRMYADTMQPLQSITLFHR